MDGCSQRFGRLPANHDRMDLATFLEQYRPGRYPLHEALVSGDLQRLQRQIIKAADLDERLPDGTTALHLAADLGMLEALECLLQHGADPELFDKDGRAPVHCAVYPYHGDGQLSWQCCQLLQASGAQLSRPCRNSVGATPLHLACRRHYHKTVEFLLDQEPTLRPWTRRATLPSFGSTLTTWPSTRSYWIEEPVLMPSTTLVRPSIKVYWRNRTTACAPAVATASWQLNSLTNTVDSG